MKKCPMCEHLTDKSFCPKCGYSIWDSKDTPKPVESGKVESVREGKVGGGKQHK